MTNNDWISIKRKYNYRILFNKKIFKKIKAKFEKQVQKQKKENQIYLRNKLLNLKKNKKKKYLNK